MAVDQLTSIANVVNWCGVVTPSDNVLLQNLINQASRFILSYIQRPTLFQKTFTDVYNGKDTVSMMLRNYPVLSVSSVIVGYNTIAPFTVPAVPSATFLEGAGYVLEPWDGYPPGRPQEVSLRGYRFQRGQANVQISYTSGFVVQNEAQTVDSTNYQAVPTTPNGPWAVDQGVTYATTGVALVAVTSSPTAGQYIPPNGANTFYQFSSSDSGANVLLTYSFVPSDINEAATELVGERYSYKTRIGIVSKSLGGQETMSYSQKDMPDYIRAILQPYRKVVYV